MPGWPRFTRKVCITLTNIGLAFSAPRRMQQFQSTNLNEQACQQGARELGVREQSTREGIREKAYQQVAREQGASARAAREQGH